MRELIIDRLKNLIELSDGYGIPRYFDCSGDEHITDVDELNDMDDEQLLEVFETNIGFQG